MDKFYTVRDLTATVATYPSIVSNQKLGHTATGGAGGTDLCFTQKLHSVYRCVQ
jgi:hypothetical protein